MFRTYMFYIKQNDFYVYFFITYSLNLEKKKSEQIAAIETRLENDEIDCLYKQGCVSNLWAFYLSYISLEMLGYFATNAYQKVYLLYLKCFSQLAVCLIIRNNWFQR